MAETRRDQLIAQLEALDEKLTRTCESSLEAFLGQAWEVVEPHTPFVGGWHIGAICEHVTAVIDFQLPQLLITIPPRLSKSTTTSICATPWAWGPRGKPGLQFMFGSYASELSVEHAVKSRRIIDSAWYQQRWGERFQLTTDQNIKSSYANTETGSRISTSVDGGVTGRGADILILDDPHNIKKIHSEAERHNVRETFYKQAWHNRVNNAMKCGRVCIMQRGHPDDLAAYLLTIGYHELSIPNEYDPKRSRVTVLGWRDPRTEPGELVCPARVDRAVTEQLKKLGSMYQAQYQQNPLPEGGKMFDRTWFRILRAVPSDVVSWVRFWDVAGTEGGRGARTAGVKMGRTATGRVVVANVTKGRWSEEGVDRAMEQCAALDGVDTPIREEQEPGSSGKAVIKARSKLLAGYDYRGVPATGDKVNRARPVAGLAEAGNIDIVQRVTGDPETDAAEALWVREFLDELEGFPYGLKDQVDAASGALNHLTVGSHGDQDLLLFGESDAEIADLAARVAVMKAKLGVT